MKVQIDTEKKSVKIENNANINDLFVFLKRILEDDFYKYTLEANVQIINWNNITHVDYKKPDWYRPLPPIYSDISNKKEISLNAKSSFIGKTIVNYEIK